MANLPLWISQLLRETAARSSFHESADRLAASAQSSVNSLVVSGKTIEAAVQVGFIEGIRALERLVSMQEKEDQINVELFEKRKGGR